MTHTPPDWSEIRGRFPAVEHQVYLNTAGGGPTSRESWEATRTYLDTFHARGDVDWDDRLREVEHTRATLATIVSAEPAEVAFLGNSSQAMHLTAELLRGEGPVVSVEDEFPSVTLPWLKQGRELRLVPSSSDGTISSRDLSEAIDNDAEVVAISSVQYATGFRIDLQQMGTLCQERGAELVIDASQGFGVFPLDFPRTRAAALCFSAYKWATAGYGIAPLVVRRDVIEARGLPAAGWRSTEQPYAMVNDRLDLTDTARGLELGHPPFAGIIALGAALELIRTIGLDAIEARVHELVERLHKRLHDAGIPVASAKQKAYRSGITIVATDEPERVASELRRLGVFVSARGRGLRVSLHFYNNEQDVDRFVELTEHILARG